VLGARRGRLTALAERRWAAGQGTTHPGEGGSAVVEFVFLAVLMLIPLIYLVMTLGRLQAGAYAVSAAAREAGRAYTTATTQADAERRAEAAAAIAFEDQGFGDTGRLSLACDGTPCLRAEGRVEVTTVVTVPLPLVPSFARDVVPLEVPLSASHVAVVDRFRGQP
jgi:Flp pilus assembly protein TadG